MNNIQTEIEAVACPQTHNTVRVVDSAIDCPDLPIIVGSGRAKAVMWPGNGALYRTFQVLDLEPNDQTIALVHPSDSAYYVAAGSGVIADLNSGERMPLVEGSMVHIDKGDHYRFEAAETAGLKLIGGPCPADPQLYAHLTTAGEAV
ncbi:conserved hypothetical protein [Hyphomicrobiales bacterium]|nr:conserved hypothetical protein [Hyphomicrobiales bacterium]